jgi:hypothetical protein
MKKFIEQEVKKELIRQGLHESRAAYYGRKSSEYYQEQLCNSKDPFRDCCNYAGQLAQQENAGFKYKQPAAKRGSRSKRPQEAFKF